MGDRLLRLCLLSLIGALSATLWWPSLAGADSVSCTYLPAGSLLPSLVSVQITPAAGGFATSIGRVGDAIRAYGDNFADCSPGTVNNVDLIALGDASPNSAGNVRNHYIPVGRSAVFAPGETPEPGDSDEIEMGVSFGPGKDQLGLEPLNGDLGPLRIAMGQGDHAYINLNAEESTGIDQDVSMEGVDTIFLDNVNPNLNDDIVRGNGGAGTGSAPIAVRLSLYGGGGDDKLIGGARADVLVGGPGRDSIGGGKGRDVIDGGKGGDVLAGAAKADDLSGRRGRDRLLGQKGRDGLVGGPGRDRLVGGPGKDHCNGGPGHDVLIGCEVITG